MRQAVVQIPLLVKDYDDALHFYTEKMHFEVLEDTDLGGGKRWVVITPPCSKGAAILLTKASKEEQMVRVGNQTGGKVVIFLATDDVWRDYREMREKGIEFIHGPENAPYGTVAVFRDLYGNLFDLIQYAQDNVLAGRLQ